MPTNQTGQHLYDAHGREICPGHRMYPDAPLPAPDPIPEPEPARPTRKAPARRG